MSEFEGEAEVANSDVCSSFKPAIADLTSTLNLAECVLNNDFFTSEDCRNIDRNWELLAPFGGAKVTVPGLYMVGDRDLILAFPRYGSGDLTAPVAKYFKDEIIVGKDLMVM